MRACRNCGRCDECLGLTAPEGFKVCRRCGDTKPVEAFEWRKKIGRYRNQCKQCRYPATRDGVCVDCGAAFRTRSESQTRCRDHRYRRDLRCAGCGEWFVTSISNRLYCSAACGEQGHRDRQRQYRIDLRGEMVAAYGGECACPGCPETMQEFLCLDHVNGDGAEHRKVVGRHAYMDLRRRGWPQDGYRLLCWNCNSMTRHGDPCPHVTVPTWGTV